MSSTNSKHRQQMRKDSKKVLNHEVHFLTENYALQLNDAIDRNASGINNNTTQPPTTVSNNVSSSLHDIYIYLLLLLTCTLRQFVSSRI